MARGTGARETSRPAAAKGHGGGGARLGHTERSGKDILETAALLPERPPRREHVRRRLAPIIVQASVGEVRIFALRLGFSRAHAVSTRWGHWQRGFVVGRGRPVVCASLGRVGGGVGRAGFGRGVLPAVFRGAGRVPGGRGGSPWGMGPWLAVYVHVFFLFAVAKNFSPLPQCPLVGSRHQGPAT